MQVMFIKHLSFELFQSKTICHMLQVDTGLDNLALNTLFIMKNIKKKLIKWKQGYRKRC
jgi:hypothetical protein